MAENSATCVKDRKNIQHAIQSGKGLIGSKAQGDAHQTVAEFLIVYKCNLGSPYLCLILIPFLKYIKSVFT